MNELDRKIREALRKEDAELFDDFAAEPSLFEMSMQIFRGRNRWLAVFAAFWTLIFISVGVFAAIRFFRADQTRDMLVWAAVCAVCMGAFALMKIWSWMEISKNFVTREIKRLELQIARLAGRIKD